MADQQTLLVTLKSKINFPLSEGSYNTALAEAGLNGDDLFDKDLKRAVELCAAELILIICTSGNTTEGGYSLTINDKASLLKIRRVYLNRWGMPDDDPDTAEPLIYDGSFLW